MKPMNQASRLMTANDINQPVRDPDDAVVELRRETVNAVAREKQLQEKVAAAEHTVSVMARQAGLALDKGDEELARMIVMRRVSATREHAALARELEAAAELARTFKQELARMQQQAGTADRRRRRVSGRPDVI